MTELVLKLALSSFAAEAREHLNAKLASGEEIPFELGDTPGEASPLYRYVPQTAKFIERHAAELRDLTSFGPACAAVGSAGVAASYLEQRGMAVPANLQKRSEQLILAFCEELWEGREDFSFEDAKLERIVREIEFGSGEGIIRGSSVLCPLVGLQLPVTKLELGTATIVRSEVTDLPPEALRSEGMGRAAWEPQFVAVAECVDGQQPAEVVNAQLSELITAMRLLQPGGVALGPHAWTQSSEGTWRRISTGAARPRGGSYVLGESDAAALIDLSRRLASRPSRKRGLSWAISRFEMGCERDTIFEGLSDYLLALRGMLDGGGPAGAALPMRISALCAEPELRDQLRATLDRAMTLEMRIMSGRAAEAAADDDSLSLAAEVEDHVRAILRDAACGALGEDLRATADEILVADGVTGGDAVADLGETSEWEPPHPPEPEIRVFATKSAEAASPSRGRTDIDTDLDEAEVFVSRIQEETKAMEISDVVTPIERARSARMAESTPRRGAHEQSRQPRAGAIQRRSVREFFPDPDTTDWSVGELRFDRS